MIFVSKTLTNCKQLSNIWTLVGLLVGFQTVVVVLALGLLVWIRHEGRLVH